MKYDLILVRYGEIALKGRETRRRFESILVNNIKNALNTENISNKINKEMGRIFIHTTQIDKSISVLKKIFGITSISPCNKIESKIESISKLAIKISKEKIDKKKAGKPAGFGQSDEQAEFQQHSGDPGIVRLFRCRDHAGRKRVSAENRQRSVELPADLCFLQTS